MHHVKAKPYGLVNKPEQPFTRPSGLRPTIEQTFAIHQTPSKIDCSCGKRGSYAAVRMDGKRAWLCTNCLQTLEMTATLQKLWLRYNTVR